MPEIINRSEFDRRRSRHAQHGERISPDTPYVEVKYEDGEASVFIHTIDDDGEYEIKPILEDQQIDKSIATNDATSAAEEAGIGLIVVPD